MSQRAVQRFLQMVAAAVLWASLVPASPAQSGLVLDEDTRQVALGPYTRHYYDAGASATLDQVQAALSEGRFAPLPDNRATFGFRPGAFWFHVDLFNRSPGERRWLLVQQYALSDQIDVYRRYPDGRIVHQQGGDHLPFSRRAVRYRHPNFELHLPVDEPVSLFVRVQSQSSMQVPLTLYTPTAFSELARDAQFSIGIYYGILLALFAYNLALWLTLRDPSYFWYLLHVSAFGLVLTALYGLGFEYLWPTSPWLADQSVPLSICLAQAAMQQFARSFLGLEQRWRGGDRVSLGFIYAFILLAVTCGAIPVQVSTQLASIGTILSVFWIAVVAVVTMRRGYKPARLFVVAWAAFLLGIGLYAMIAFNLVPKNFLTEYGVQIGSGMEMLLLSIALGYRYGILRSENERIVREANELLEAKVEQRTAELSSALGQLHDAHMRLREFVRYDGLTNLYNRSFFRESFESLLRQARDADRPICLLMIDLDHFKQINDEHGHLVGDECLRFAAGVMANVLHPHGALLARYGGEEFIAALPGLDLRQASTVANELRLALRQAPCRSAGNEVWLSASIGVHAVDPSDEDSLEDALQVADQALYAAKSGGRDCVRVL